MAHAMSHRAVTMRFPDAGRAFVWSEALLNKLVRVLFALTAVAPLAVSLAYVFARQNALWYAGGAVLASLTLAWISKEVISAASRRLERVPITIKKAKSADKEVLGFFVAYALPLIFRGQGSPDLGEWIVAGVMLLLVLWGTHSLQVNPVLGLLGFHFFEVEADDGITYLLITERRIDAAKSVTTVVQLSEYGILEAN